MTEAEWFAEPDFARHVAFVADRLSARKVRLLAAALCRAAFVHEHADLVRCVESVERHADGDASVSELESARKRCRAWAIQAYERQFGRPDDGDEYGPRERLLHTDPSSRLAWAVAVAASTPLELPRVAGLLQEAFDGAAGFRLRARAVVWEVVGNPFRPVAFDFAPAWRTSTAVGVAGEIAATCDFSAMPILADALQDAGCDDEDVLKHCRDPHQAHARGCWVVDLVLDRG